MGVIMAGRAWQGPCLMGTLAWAVNWLQTSLVYWYCICGILRPTPAARALIENGTTSYRVL